MIALQIKEKIQNDSDFKRYLTFLRFTSRLISNFEQNFEKFEQLKIKYLTCII